MSWRLLAAACAATFALAGCGSDESTTEAKDSPTSAASEARFPVTVVHKYGKTTIARKPERIVVAGLTEQDTVLALGEQPVGVTEWYGGHPSATWPWAQDRLAARKPMVLSTDDGFEYEKIATLRPDLILAVNAGAKKGDFEKLSKIAPTVGPDVGSTDYFSKWDSQVRVIAEALGRKADGERLVADVKARFAKAAHEHPEFAGKTVSFAQNAFYSGQLYAYQDGLNTEFLTMLGFTINPKLTPLVQNPGEQVGISEEKLDVLDADAIVFATEKPEDITKLFKVPTFKQLAAVAENRAVYTDATLSGAMYFMTPLSLNYVADRLPALLQQAIDGEAPRTMAAVG